MDAEADVMAPNNDSRGAQAIGGAVLADLDGHTGVLIRETLERYQQYPSECGIEIRLAHWEVLSVLVTSVLVRVAERDDAIFAAWLNIADEADAGLLLDLAEQHSIPVSICSDGTDPPRLAWVPNTLRSKARALISMVQGRRTWPASGFTHARRALTNDVSTPLALWDATLRAR